MKVSIILPTFNERENIRVLIPSIGEVMRKAGLEYEIVVVDDNSPDGTAEEAVKLSNIYPVRVVRRPGKMGLSSSVYEGVKHSTGDVIVVMDADLQHPPEYIPVLVKRIQDGCDITVASRYVKGGRVEGFPVIRQLVSKASIFLAHMLVRGSRRVRDAVSGFFAARKSILQYWRLVEPRGYKVLVEILAEVEDARVCEEPFTFKGRASGSSKLSSRVILSYVRMLYKLNARLFLLYLTVVLLALLLLLLAL